MKQFICGAWPSTTTGNLGDDILSKITLKSGVGTIVETGSDDGHFMTTYN